MYKLLTSFSNYAVKSIRTPANWFGNIKANNLKNHLTLKDLRISKGFKTSISFADACGLNPSTYSQIETGAHIPKPSTRKTIANMLDVDVEEIFPKQQELQVKLVVIHETPSQIETMLQKQYGDKLIPRKCL